MLIKAFDPVETLVALPLNLSSDPLVWLYHQYSTVTVALSESVIVALQSKSDELVAGEGNISTALILGVAAPSIV